MSPDSTGGAAADTARIAAASCEHAVRNGSLASPPSRSASEMSCLKLRGVASGWSAPGAFHRVRLLFEQPFIILAKAPCKAAFIRTAGFKSLACHAAAARRHSPTVVQPIQYLRCVAGGEGFSAIRRRHCASLRQGKAAILALVVRYWQPGRG